MIYGIDLERAMSLKGISCQVLGDLLGVNASTVRKWKAQGVPYEYADDVKEALGMYERESACLERATKTTSGARFGRHF